MFTTKEYLPFLLLVLTFVCAGQTLAGGKFVSEPNEYEDGGGAVFQKNSPRRPCPATPIKPALRNDSQSLSPRLNRLRQDVGSGNSRALEFFWREITERGTPLIEPVESGGQYVLVTFLWRGNGETKNVVVLTLGNSQLANAEYFAEAQMTNLSGTDVWFKTYRMRDDARFSYRVAANDSLAVVKNFTLDPQRAAAFKADPLNKRHYASIYGDSSVVELGGAPPQTWVSPLPGLAEGKVEKLSFRSRILNNERDLWIYTPPDYPNNKGGYHLLVTLDGEGYVTGIPTPTILNNLIGRGKLPPTVAVMVGNAEGARIRELFYNDQFNEFFAEELIPWVREHYRVTAEPDETILAGSSLGGNAVVYLAMRHPEIFGNVLAQSGGFMYRRRREDSFGPRQPGELLEENFPENEWLTRQFVARPKLAIRFYLEAGLLEDAVWRESPPRLAVPSLLSATRHLRDVLQAKGYDICYNEFNGAHEDLSWRGTFADGLIALAGNGCSKK